MDFNKILRIIKPAIKEAGDRLAEEFSSKRYYEFKVKSKGEIITRADRIAEEILLSKIRKHFPKHSILSEESGMADNKSEYMWIVDPLDGTTNFAMKNPFFNTSVALVLNNEIVLGFVYAPLFDEFYVAIKGQGALVNDEKIKVDEEADMQTGLNAFCYGSAIEAKLEAAEYYKKALAKGYQVRQLGAAALELARVGSGILDSIVVPGANPWDVAAGALIVEEAGGIITDMAGNKFDLMERNGIIAASSEKVYSQVREIL